MATQMVKTAEICNGPHYVENCLLRTRFTHTWTQDSIGLVTMVKGIVRVGIWDTPSHVLKTVEEGHIYLTHMAQDTH